MKIADITTDTATLAKAMFEGSDLATFNAGFYEGTATPIRRMSGAERVLISGSTSGAKVITGETWIVDRFGALGARQVKRLIALLAAAKK